MYSLHQYINLQVQLNVCTCIDHVSKQIHFFQRCTGYRMQPTLLPTPCLGNFINKDMISRFTSSLHTQESKYSLVVLCMLYHILPFYKDFSSDWRLMVDLHRLIISEIVVYGLKRLSAAESIILSNYMHLIKIFYAHKTKLCYNLIFFQKNCLWKMHPFLHDLSQIARKD